MREFSAADAGYDSLISEAAATHGVPPALLRALIMQESGFNKRARNAETGAYGMGQHMPKTAEALGVTDPEDPVQAIGATAKYLREGFDREGSVRGALTYYYGGPNKDQWGARTRMYPAQVLRRVKTDELPSLLSGFSERKSPTAREFGPEEAAPLATPAAQFPKEFGPEEAAGAPIRPVDSQVAQPVAQVEPIPGAAAPGMTSDEMSPTGEATPGAEGALPSVRVADAVGAAGRLFNQANFGPLRGQEAPFQPQPQSVTAQLPAGAETPQPPMPIAQIPMGPVRPGPTNEARALNAATELMPEGVPEPPTLQGLKADKFDWQTAKEYDRAPAGRRMLKVMHGSLDKAAVGVAKMIADSQGDEELQRKLGEMYADRNASMDALQSFGDRALDPNSLQVWIQKEAENIGASIAQNIPTMGLALLGAPIGGLLGMGLLSMGDEYADARRQGRDQEDALQRAAWYGTFEVAGEMLGLPSFSRFAKAALGKGGVPNKELMMKLLEHQIHEQLGEQYTTAGEFLVDKLKPYGMHHGATFADYMEQVQQTFVTTVGQTFVMGGAGALANKAMKKWTPEGRAQVAADAAEEAKQAALDKWAKFGESLKSVQDSISEAEGKPVPPAAVNVEKPKPVEPEPTSQETAQPEATEDVETGFKDGMSAIKRAVELTKETGVQHRARPVKPGEFKIVRDVPVNTESTGPSPESPDSTATGGAMGGEETAGAGRQEPQIPPERAAWDKIRAEMGAEPMTDEEWQAVSGETPPVEEPPLETEPGTIAPVADHEINDNPTPGQAEAGNYKQAPREAYGMELGVETRQGGTRTGTDGKGKEWSVEMLLNYGKIKGTTAADGEEMDVYFPDGLDVSDEAKGTAFIVDQYRPSSGKFDEHKVFLLPAGTSIDEAKRLYDAHFSDGSGPTRRHAVTEVSIPELKHWLATGNTKEQFSQEDAGDEGALEGEPAPEPAGERPTGEGGGGVTGGPREPGKRGEPAGGEPQPPAGEPRSGPVEPPVVEGGETGKPDEEVGKGKQGPEGGGVEGGTTAGPREPPKVEPDKPKEPYDHKKRMQEEAAKIGSDPQALERRLRDAKGVLDAGSAKALGAGKFDFENKRLIADDGSFALQWKNDGETNAGSVSVVKVKADPLAVTEIDYATLEGMEVYQRIELEDGTKGRLALPAAATIKEYDERIAAVKKLLECVL